MFSLQNVSGCLLLSLLRNLLQLSLHHHLFWFQCIRKNPEPIQSSKCTLCEMPRDGRKLECSVKIILPTILCCNDLCRQNLEIAMEKQMNSLKMLFRLIFQKLFRSDPQIVPMPQFLNLPLNQQLSVDKIEMKQTPCSSEAALGECAQDENSTNNFTSTIAVYSK